MKRLIVTGTLIVGLVAIVGCGAHFGLTWMDSYPIIDVNVGDANFKNGGAKQPQPIVIYFKPRADDTAETTPVLDNEPPNEE